MLQHLSKLGWCGGWDGLVCRETRLADYEAQPNSLQLFKSLGFERQLLNAHICPRFDFVPRMMGWHHVRIPARMPTILPQLQL